MPIINTPKIIGRSLLIIFAFTSIYLYFNPRTVTETVTTEVEVTSTEEQESKVVDKLNQDIIKMERFKESITRIQEQTRKERDDRLKALSTKWDQKEKHLNPNLYRDAECLPGTTYHECTIISKTKTLEGRKAIMDVNSNTGNNTGTQDEPTTEEETFSWVSIIEE